MLLDDALRDISLYYNIDKSILLDFLEKNKKTQVIDNIILPYFGKICQENCKGIVFNHGLYTQCCEKVKTKFCKVCEKEKYGSIYDREKYEIGQFVTNSGKQELSYSKFVKKMKYNMDDVKRSFCLNDIKYSDYFDEVQNKSRGRPRKETIQQNNTENNEDTIEVIEVEIDGLKYLKSKEGVLLDNMSYEIVGIYRNNKIEKID